MKTSRVIQLIFLSVIVAFSVSAFPEPDCRELLLLVQQRFSFNERISIELPSPSEPGNHLEGHFTNSKALAKSGIALLSGDDLYLFPDGSYLFVEWADIEPETIYDKGAWRYEDGFIYLASDGSVPGAKYVEDAKFLPVIFASRLLRELAIIGIPHDLDDLLEQPEKDSSLNAEFSFHLNSRARIGSLKGKKGSDIKQNLLKKAWRPDFWSSGA